MLGWSRVLRLGKTWVVSVWKIVHFASFQLGKHPWDVAIWENTLGKVPNIKGKVKRIFRTRIEKKKNVK